MRKFIGLILSVILFSSILPIFADEGYFEDDYRRELYSEPIVCIFQPDDARVDKQKWKIWISDMKPALETWRSILSSSSYSGGNWEITLVDIPLDKQDRVNYSACDIKVHFTPTSYPEHPEWLGWYTYGTGEIKLVYTKSEICKTVLNSKYHIYEYGYCQTDLLERSKRMASVLQHEFGHALGLSHYVSDNSALIQQWYDNDGIGAPSIMTVQPPNEELKKITSIDVNLVREIYGYQGFGKKTNNPSVFFEPIIEPKHEPEVSGIQNIQVKPYQTTSTKITGYIPEELYSRGTPVEFEITKPDGTKESSATMVSSHQYFEYPMVFGSSSLTGTYEILVIYKGEFVQKNVINISKSTTTNNNQNSVLSNVNGASGKYLEKISITSDDNKYQVKSFFGKTSSVSSIRVTAENECPMKKQVFQKDFIFRSGTEVSFSFFQLSSGKPYTCSIHFSITDFDGHELDSIKVDYDLQTTAKQSTQTTKSQPIQTTKSTVQKNIENNQKESAFELKNNIHKKLDELRDKFSSARKTLESMSVESSVSKEKINQARTLLRLNWEMSEFEERVQRGDRQMDFNEFANAKTWYTNNEKSIQESENILKQISTLIEEVQKVEQKTCFLFWCW